MTGHVVIGTAGHVDHGKTALVRALTGVDTDRWEEERRRGITIDLGFAALDLGDGVTASIVDVPGHEDFVRNMVAGATGIDLGLLVVAADESVMPQTIEHLTILEALGVSAGVVAVAKSDLVEPAWLELVTGDVRQRLETGTVAWQGVIPVSSVTGAGLAALVDALRDAARSVPGRQVDDVFRMPVDRAFSVSGAGTVVTGTTWSGSVRAGDEVIALPGGHRARVRGVEVHGTPSPAAAPGRRTALALVGVDRQSLPRGTTIVAGEGWRATEVLDVLLTLTAEAPPLTQRSRIRVHLGTAEVLARVTPATDAIAPGETAAARLRLEGPVVARWGDRGVVRSYSPVTTIGGLVVADPWPALRPRRPQGVEELLGQPAARVPAAVRRAGARGLPVADLVGRLGVLPAEVGPLLAGLPELGLRAVGDRLVPGTAVDDAAVRLLRRVDEVHRRDPLAAGLTLEQARTLGPPALIDAALAGLVAGGAVAVDGAVIHRVAHQPAQAAADHPVVTAVGNAIRKAGFEGMTATELVPVAPLTESVRVLEYLMRERLVVRVGRERFYDADVLDAMVGKTTAALLALGQVGPAQLREELGLTRKYLIPFLEWLDAQGYTVRRGDLRVAGPRLTKGSAAS